MIVIRVCVVCDRRFSATLTNVVGTLLATTALLHHDQLLFCQARVVVLWFGGQNGVYVVVVEAHVATNCEKPR